MNLFSILLLIVPVTIDMTNEGFVPSEITVDKGTVVRFINRDKVDRWPASNLHPTHGIYPEFDPKTAISGGSAWEFRFDRVGEFRYHDHLLPHQKGKIVVRGSIQGSTLQAKIAFFIKDLREKIFHLLLRERNLSISSSEFRSLTQEEQLKLLDRMIQASGLSDTWKFVVSTYQTRIESVAHDLAHFMGIRIYEKEGLTGLSLCDPSFAFGCYHGFSEAAFRGSLDSTFQMEKACQTLGEVGSGPWASCVHGIGHGIATYFDSSNLRSALLACDRFRAGSEYCYDGVFMEFSISAPKSVFEKISSDPLYPCSEVESQYKKACGRSQPRLMRKYLGLSISEVAQICLSSMERTIKDSCIDAMGLMVGQESGANADRIFSQCRTIKENYAFSQCVSSAASEIVFQNYKGWQKASFAACEMLSTSFKQICLDRVQNVVSSYKRN